MTESKEENPFASTPRYWITWMTLLASAFIFYPWIVSSSWASNSDVLAILEFWAAFVALTAGLIIMTLYFWVPMRRMGTHSGLRRRQLLTCDAQGSNWMRRILNCIPRSLRLPAAHGNEMEKTSDNYKAVHVLARNSEAGSVIANSYIYD